ncbi:MAG: hypothetical protein QOI11_2127, partial [Candidatus Eremiobacteraeota bacterium]|nr:hypothetical protein [Candidatus Eremiobacteraeota bacterium]
LQALNYKHSTKYGTVVMARHGRGRDVPMPLVTAILKQAGLR